MFRVENISLFRRIGTRSKEVIRKARKRSFCI